MSRRAATLALVLSIYLGGIPASDASLNAKPITASTSASLVHGSESHDPRWWHEAIGGLSQSATEKWPKTFAGLWVDHDGDEDSVVVAFTRDAELRERELDAMFPWPHLLQATTAQHSYAELQRRQSKLIADRERVRAGALAIPGMIGARYDLDIDIRRNRVVVRVPDVTPIVSVAFQSRYGTDLDIQSGIMQPHSSCTTDDCLHTLISGLGTTDCSTGFATRTNGVLGIFSAGHCDLPPAHGGRVYGTVSGDVESGRVDAEWHRVNTAGGFDVAPATFRFDDASWPVWGTETWSQMYVGEQACLTGWATRTESCGRVTSKDAAPSYIPGSNRFIEADTCEAAGDSGAGVYNHAGNALGILSGGNPLPCGAGHRFVFSQIEYVQAALGQSVWTGHNDRDWTLASISATQLSPTIDLRTNWPVDCGAVDSSDFEVRIDTASTTSTPTVVSTTCAEYTNSAIQLVLDSALLPESRITVTSLPCRLMGAFWWTYYPPCSSSSSQSATVGDVIPVDIPPIEPIEPPIELPTCPVQVADLTTGRAGGTVQPYDSPDDSWQITSSPGSGATTPAYSTRPHPAWYSATTANWINPGPSGPTNQPPGNYRYSTSFTVPDPSLLRPIEISIAADDLVQIWVNGVYLGFIEGFSYPATFTLDPSLLTTGANTFDADVLNYNNGSDNPTGLLLEGAICM